MEKVNRMVLKGVIYDSCGKNCLNILYIILISSFVRFLFPLSNHIFSSNYHFLGTNIPYYLKADSYFFYLQLSNLGLSKLMIYIFPYTLTLLSFVFFYFICKELFLPSFHSFLATLCFSFFPYIYDQTLLGYVDTPHFIILCIVSFVYFYIKFIKNVHSFSIFAILTYFLIFICIICLLAYFWTGFPIITLMLLLGIFFQYARSFKHFIIGFLIALIPFFLYYSRLKTLIMYKGLGVSEYQTPRLMMYYFLILIIVWLYFKHKDDQYINFFVGCLIFAFAFSLLIGRFAAFAGIFIILLLAKYSMVEFKTYNMRSYFFLIFILFSLVSICFGQINTKPLINRPYELALSNLEPNISVVTYWDNGHIIKALSGNEFVSGNHPKNTNYVINLVNGILLDEKDGIRYLDKLNTTPRYYFVLHSNDYNKTLYLQHLVNDTSDTSNNNTYWYITKEYIPIREKFNNSIIKRSLKGESSDYFELKYVANFEDMKYWIYQRRK